MQEVYSLIWFLENNKRLSRRAQQALDDATIPLVVPTIVLAEVAFLHSRGRVAVDAPAVIDYINAEENCSFHHFDEEVARRLPLRLEMHDAMIVATVLLIQETTGQEVALITRDEQITASGLVRVIW